MACGNPYDRDPPSLKQRRDKSAFVKTSVAVAPLAGLWRDRHGNVGKGNGSRESIGLLAGCSWCDNLAA